MMKRRSNVIPVLYTRNLRFEPQHDYYIQQSSTEQKCVLIGPKTRVFSEA